MHYFDLTQPSVGHTTEQQDTVYYSTCQYATADIHIQQHDHKHIAEFTQDYFIQIAFIPKTI